MYKICAPSIIKYQIPIYEVFFFSSYIVNSFKKISFLIIHFELLFFLILLEALNCAQNTSPVLNLRKEKNRIQLCFSGSYSGQTFVKIILFNNINLCNKIIDRSVSVCCLSISTARTSLKMWMRIVQGRS